MSENLPALRPAYTVADVERMARSIAASGLFGCRSVEQAAALMLVAQAEGKHPATAAAEYDIIQGRPALKSSAILARFQVAGGSVRWVQSDDTAAIGEFTHQQGGTLRVSWTMDRAKAAGLVGKDNWKKYPAAMLRARCAAEGVRAVYPACLFGFYGSEEILDASGDIGPAVPRSEIPAAEVVEETPPPPQTKPATIQHVTPDGEVVELPARFTRREAMKHLRAVMEQGLPSVEGESINARHLGVLRDILGDGKGRWGALDDVDDAALYQIIRKDAAGVSRLTRAVDLRARHYRRPDDLDASLWPPPTDEALEELGIQPDEEARDHSTPF